MTTQGPRGLWARLTWNYTRHATIALILAVVIASIAFYVLGRSTGPTFRSPTLLASRIVLNQPHPPGDPATAPRLPILHVVQPPLKPFYMIPRPPLIDDVQNQGQVGQCQCEAFKLQIDTLYYRATGYHRHISCRWFYSIVGGGSDPGSSLDQYVSAVRQYGIVFSRIWDYQGTPDDSQLNYTYAKSLIPQALPHRYNLITHMISGNYGSGFDAVNECEREMTQNRPCNFGAPVYQGANCNGFFDASSNGIIDSPADVTLCQLVGYHATTFIGFDRNLCKTTSSGNTCGFFVDQNSWGKRGYGVNCKTLQPDPISGGCVLASFRFVATYGFWLATIQLQQGVKPKAQKAPLYTQPGPAGDKPLPPPKNIPKVIKVVNGTPWVYHVYAKDTHQDLAPAINYWATHEGITPVGLLAVVGAECGLYTRSYTCDRTASCADTSFGPMQVTVATAAQFGVGNGVCDGYYGYNTSRVRTYENVAPQGVRLGAQVLGYFHRYELTNCPSASQLPQLYVSWNAGPNQPCWFLLQPNGQAGANYYQNFLGWQRWAYSYVRYGKNPYAKHKGR